EHDDHHPALHPVPHHVAPAPRGGRPADRRDRRGGRGPRRRERRGPRDGVRSGPALRRAVRDASPAVGLRPPRPARRRRVGPGGLVAGRRLLHARPRWGHHPRAAGLAGPRPRAGPAHRGLPAAAGERRGRPAPAPAARAPEGGAAGRRRRIIRRHPGAGLAAGRAGQQV
ncbi:MAG: hypothetical protein AVDCRST_MAG48-1952, partial [uncultured Friedmanniella sp.]